MKRALSVIMLILLLVSAFPSSGIFGDSRPIETGAGDDVPVLEDPQVSVLEALRDEIATLEMTGFAGSLERVVDAALASGRPVFLYFYAEWCYYCQQEGPIVDALDATFADAVVVIRVDGERNPEAMRAFDVEGFPTMLVIYGRTSAGYEHLAYSGFTEQAGLEDVLHAVVNGEFLLSDMVEGVEPSGSCTQPYTHHSCSFGKCYEDCILEQFYPSDPIAKALQAGKVQQAITDFLQACAGAKAAKALQTIYDGVKNTKCGLQCAQADKTGEPRDIGECTRCMIAGTAGKIPGAGCVIELWNTLGDLLVPHSDCIAECAAPPQTWSKNWGHPCRPKRSPDRYRCVGPSARGKYVCIDCEWYLVKASVEECPIYAPQCVSTPSGPRCVDQCEKLNCDDGDPCTIDWCHSKEGCKHDRKPGCDHPDDNEDASDPVFTAAELIYEDPEIAVLSNGFSPYLVSQLNRYNASSGLIDVSLQGLANYSVLLVPSGGLSGLDTSPTVRSHLDAFVREGGTLIVFAQQHGYEYQALPGGGLRAYGWLEDQSCQHASVFISDYHPIFAGQSAATLNVNVDGFFTESPANSTVLLSRTKNAMPAMVLYSYGRGRVLASTLYSDMAISLYQATRDETALLRDLIAWATAPGAVPSYAPGAVRVPIEVFNPLVGPITYPVSEFASGALVALPVNVTNAGNVTSDAVAFALFNPRYALTWINVTATIPVNQSALVDLTYPTSGTSPSGIWSLFYLLSAGGEATHAGWGDEFALNYSLADLSQLQGFVTVYDPDGRVVSTVENVSLTVPPGRFGTLNATLSASTPGIWTARYSVLAADGRVVTSTSQAFAVSVFQESEAGLAYQGSPISLTITSDHEQYAAGSNASFTFHLWNHGDDAATVTTVWSLPHNYWMMRQEEYGAPGTTNPGYYNTTLRATHTVPAHGNVSFDYFVPVYDTDRLWAQFYLGDEPSTSYLGLETRGFFVFTPGILVTPDLVKPRYLRSEVAQLNVTLQNVQRWSYNATVHVWVLDADNAKIYDTSFTTLLPLGSLDVVALNFTVPPTAHPGSASVFAEVTSRGKRIGYGAAYFEILSLPLRVLFDQATYRVREDLGVTLHLSNPSLIPLSAAVNLSIPDLAFTAQRVLEADPGETTEVLYSLPLPASLHPGKHAVRLTVLEENVTVTYPFFIPRSTLDATVVQDAVAAGEDLTIRLNNTGGVDAAYALHVTLLDPYLQAMIDDIVADTLHAGAHQALTFPIPDAAINGTYFLFLQLDNQERDATTRMMQTLTVRGVAATLTAAPDADVYTVDDLLTVFTDITSLYGPLTDAVLTLQLRSTVPSPPTPCVVPVDGLLIAEDTVLCPGTYSVPDLGESGVLQVIRDDVTIEGNRTIIIGDSGGTFIRNQGHHGLTVRNVEIQQYLLGIEILDADRTVIANTTILSDRGGAWGVKLYNASDATVSHNNLSHLDGNGIYLRGEYDRYSARNTISHNLLNYNEYGLRLQYVQNSTVASNVASDNVYDGFDLTWVHNTTLAHNLALQNGERGIALQGESALLVNNTMAGNSVNLYLRSDAYQHVIPTSNTVDGQPVYWLNGQSHRVIDASSNAGYVGVVNADNVTVRDLVLTTSDPGVVLYNVTNSRVENVTVTGVGIGVMIENARHNTISQCSATENEYGIWLRDDAFNTTLIGNTVRYNALQGIYVYDAHNTTIRGNTVRNHYNIASSTISGIYLRMAHNNTIVDNALTSNFFGIYLHAMNENNTIRGNVLASSSDTGIKVYSSTRNVVDNNTVTSGKQGIYLTYGGDNTVTNNAIISTTSLGGIFLQSSTGNTISHNHLTGNNQGIRFTYSDNNTVVSNVAEGSYYDGMWLEGSYNVVANNNASWNNGGIGIRGDHNQVTGNVAAHNRDEGMSFYESNDNRITNNTLSHNTWGLWLSGSERNALMNNTMTDTDYNFAVFGTSWEPFAYNNAIDASNLVDGRPIVYLVNASDVVVDASWNPGTVYVINGVNVTVTGLNLTRNVDGIFLFNTNGSTITDNRLSQSETGVNLLASHGNTVVNNTVELCEYGVDVHDSSRNVVLANRLSNNTDGISGYQADDVQVLNNTLTWNLVGVSLGYSANGTVRYNAIEHGTRGIRLSSMQNGTFAHNTVRHQAAEGIVLLFSEGNTIANNRLIGNQYGLSLDRSTANLVTGNNASAGNVYGIYIGYEATGNTLRDNTMSGNVYNFGHQQLDLTNYANDIDASNLVDGRPIRYLVNASDVVVDVSWNPGTVYVIHGVNVTVQDLHLANASAGVRFYNTSFSRIENVTIASSEYGLYLYLSSNNTLQHINASHGEYGLYLYLSSNNTLQHINASLNDVGLDIYRSDDNTLLNVTANANREDGIDLDGDYNRITSCVANGNQDQGLDISGAYNVITENTANDNLIGISFYYVENELSRNVFCNNTLYDIDYDDDESNGDNNTCTTVYQGYVDGWKDEGLTTFGCTYSCTGPPAPAPPQPAALAPSPQLAPTGIPHGPAGAPDLASVAPDPAELLVPTPQVAPAPSAPTNGASDVIWEETVILDVTDTARVTSAIDALNLTGKFYLYATLASSSGQLLAFAIAPFYVTDQDYALTLTTDRPVYKPGETVTITGTLENMGAAQEFTITVTADGVPIYTDTASVVADNSYPFTASTTAVASFTLTGLVDGLNVTDRVRVEAPAVNASLEAPALVGRDPFDVTIALVNTGNVSADLTVTLGAEAWTVTVPGGEAQYLQTQRSLTGNATLTATVTGDVTRTLQQDVVYGEAATITVAPDDVYVEGPVAIPYTIRNTGRLATTFTATFTLDGQIVTRDVYLPVGENVSDAFTITLTRGRYTMSYASPFWSGQVPVDVESEPDLVLTSFPENVTLILNERANLTVTITNRGSREGEAQMALESPGLFDAATRTWVAGDASADVTVTVQSPDDVEEGTYALVYTLNGQRYATTCTILGAKIAVLAALDRALYAAGANATLTLTVTNLRAMNLSLYARVNLNATDHLRPFSLTEYASTTLSVTLPVAFGSKLLYTVYHSTGRALYINALYLYEQPPDVAGISLTTDRQVYAMGDTVALRVNVTRADTLTLTVFDLAVTENLTVGDHVYTVDVPLLRSGTYPITYAYGNHTATHPIDVVGYAGRVTESSIDQPAYTAGDTVNLTLVVDVTRAFDGVVVLTLHDPLGAVAGTTSVNHTFTVGANALHVAVPVDTTATGLHTATYKVYAYGSLIFITSGARYFDATYVDDTPPSITHTPINSGEPDTAIPVYALVTDDVAVEAVALYYRQVGATSYTRLPMPKCGMCIDTYNATIPASVVTTDLEYYLNATDGANVALDGTPTSPHRVTVDRAPAAVTLSTPTSVTHNALTLAWTVSDAPDFANYALYQSTTQGALGTRIATITDASTASYTITGLAPTTTYHFTVRVTDIGGLSVDSTQISATTTAAPPPAEIPWLYVGIALAAVAIVAILVVSRRGGL